MKKIIFISLLGFINGALAAQNVGIGTTLPIARLHVADSAVIFSAPSSTGNVVGNAPINGAGKRMMWYPAKTAFRVGMAGRTGAVPDGSNYWDTENIGFGSFSAGINTMAKGGFSVAMGYQAFAMGDFSTALCGNTSTGQYSVAMGIGTEAKSFGSISLGRWNDPNGNGTDIWGVDDPILYIGNGSSNVVKSNAIVVFSNGNTDISGFTQLGKTSEAAPSIKMKKLIGYTTPSSATPNTFRFVPHGITDPNKILSISVIVTDGGYQFLPHSPDAGSLFTVNTDPFGGGAGPSIAIGVKSVALSSSVMNKPIRILITYEE